MPSGFDLAPHQCDEGQTLICRVRQLLPLDSEPFRHGQTRWISGSSLSRKHRLTKNGTRIKLRTAADQLQVSFQGNRFVQNMVRRAEDQELPSRTTGRWRVAADFIGRRALAADFFWSPEICRSPYWTTKSHNRSKEEQDAALSCCSGS